MRVRHGGRQDEPLHRAGPAYRRSLRSRSILGRSALRQFIAGYGHWVLAGLLAIFLAAILAPKKERSFSVRAETSSDLIADASAPADAETASERLGEGAASGRPAPDQAGETTTFPYERTVTVEPAGETPTETVSLVIDPGPNGGYFVRGTINQQEVVFIVDTGASWIVIPERLRSRLKLVRGRYVQVTTASGVVGNYETQVGSLALGPMEFRNVPGVLNPHAPNDLVLLGMSALKDIRIEQSQGRLTLMQQRSSVSEGDETASPLPYRRPRRPLRDCSSPGQVIDRRTLECIEGH